MTAVPVAPGTHFGQGLTEPYALALAKGAGTLTLRPDTEQTGDAVDFDVRGWCADASPAELSLLKDLGGPLLDIGCGPGRLLSAAQNLGLTAWGIDTSAEAVRRARSRGARVLEQSVFDPVPHTGQWQSVILFDGNIGIGGGITALLRRCRHLIAPHGTLLVEVDADDELDTVYTAVLEDSAGNRSAPFRWARTGTGGVEARALRSGWTVASVHRVQDRVFCRLSPTAWPYRAAA